MPHFFPLSKRALFDALTCFLFFFLKKSRNSKIPDLPTQFFNRLWAEVSPFKRLPCMERFIYYRRWCQQYNDKLFLCMPTYHSVLMLISDLECSALSLLKFALKILFSFSVAGLQQCHQLYALCGLRTPVKGDITRICISATFFPCTTWDQSLDISWSRLIIMRMTRNYFSKRSKEKSITVHTISTSKIID